MLLVLGQATRRNRGFISVSLRKRMPRTLGTQVLIADDERVIADTLCAILNGSGYRAHAAYCGEQAVEVAGFLNPDILIIDVIMGGISGIEAAIQISDRDPDCRVILFSGHIAEVDLINDIQAIGRSFEVLAKPIHPLVLLDRLTRVLLTA
jgi:CheY-like chemotaxis protein